MDRMLRILVQEHQCYVALCEEFPNVLRGKMGGLLFDRRITRVITPGTLIDEKFLDAYENNYLLALQAPMLRKLLSAEIDANSSHPVGLAWLDLSTGDFFTQESTLAGLGGDLARIRPREVLLSDKYRGMSESEFVKRLEADKIFITYHPQPPSSQRSIQAWEEMLESPLSRHLVNQFSELEILAGTHLLQYVKAQLPGLSITLQPPIKRFPEETMGIDGNTMRSLEIKQTIRDGLFKGSLMHTIKRTVTKSGTRLLALWLSECTLYSRANKLTVSNKIDIASPITSLNIIEEDRKSVV